MKLKRKENEENVCSCFKIMNITLPTRQHMQNQRNQQRSHWKKLNTLENFKKLRWRGRKANENVKKTKNIKS